LSIDITAYLQDIDPEHVCGDDLQYDPDFIALDQAIKGKPEQQVGGTIQEAEPPNWREIKKNSQALLSRTIDLRILIFYCRSLIATEGYSGLQQGLELLKTLVERRWSDIHPQLDPDDDNDPTERVNILMSLCDYDTLLRPLSQVPLIESKLMGKFNFREISIASGKTTATNTEKAVQQSSIDAAVQDSEVDALIQMLTSLTASLEYLNQLENFVTAQVGVSDAPSFVELRSFLKEAQAFLKDWHHTRGIGDEVVVEAEQQQQTADSVAGVSTSSTKSVSGAIHNNQDVLKALSMICDYYKKNEPSSPVPLFLERATRLVGKSFMEVLEDVAPQGVDQAMVFKGKQNDD
jgi:type VI secretion system protein ImpA